MNQFKSGTLLVIAATAIVAILMLMTDRDIAPKKQKEVVETLKTEVEAEAVVKTEATEATETSKEESVESVAIKSTEEDGVSNNNEKATLITQEPKEIAAPEGPYSKSETKDEDHITSEKTAENEESVIAKNDEKIEEPIKAESIKVMATSTQHDLLNHLIQPIWMDQKLGEFKSVEKGEVVFKMMPTTPDGIQGEDPQQVVTDNSDKFAPTTVSADYNYQQMPMYNGGYYIAPMPPYLMESMLPMSEPVKAQ